MKSLDEQDSGLIKTIVLVFSVGAIIVTIFMLLPYYLALVLSGATQDLFTSFMDNLGFNLLIIALLTLGLIGVVFRRYINLKWFLGD